MKVRGDISEIRPSLVYIGLDCPQSQIKGYGSCDTDTDEEEAEEGSRISAQVPIESWCSCGLCIRLPSEIDNYCCRESTCLMDLILEAKSIPCVTEYKLFKTAIGNQEVLELCAFGMDQRKFPVYKNGKIKAEGLRYTAYKNFLNMCGIRWIGKHRRYALPACVIGEIRRLYPSASGQYTAFKESKFFSRLE